MKKIYLNLLAVMLLAFSSIAALELNAQTVLAPGDIAILGEDVDNEDFEFVPLVDLEAGTVINFTDNGVYANGTIRTGEGTAVYTAPTAIAKGTVIGFSGSTDFTWATNINLSSSGDQIIAYQGTEAAPVFIYAITSAATVWSVEVTGTNNSALPTGLIDGYTAVAYGKSATDLDEYDNIWYNMSVLTGTQKELLMAIGNKANWAGDDAAYTTPTGTFTVNDPVADTQAPAWATEYPKAVNIMDVQFDLAVQLDEISKVYYVVVDGGSSEPSVEEVVAGTGAAGAAVLSGGSFYASISEMTMTITGLTVGQTYDAYLVAEDIEASPNRQAAVTKVSATTIVMPSDLVSTTFKAGLDPFTAVSVSGTGAWTSSSSYGAVMACGADQIEEDWLISAAINMDAASDEKMSFSAAYNNGTAVMTVLYSNDFNGTYDAASIAAATWTDISGQFVLSAGGSWSFVPSGEADISALSGTTYFAFKVTSDNSGASWEVTNFLITGYPLSDSDATLSDLMVDGTTVSGFASTTYDYVVVLPAGTTTVPTVSYTTTEAGANAVVVDATDLAGDDAARTTTITVTAPNDVDQAVYTIKFNPVIAVATVAEFRAVTDLTRVYSITGEVLVTSKDSYNSRLFIEDASAGIIVFGKNGAITTTYEIGDKIAGMTGTLEVYKGMKEFIPYTDPGAAASTGNDVVPTTITISQFNTELEAYEGRYVKLEGMVFADQGGTFANGTNYNFTIGDVTGVLRTDFYDRDYIGTTIPTIGDVSGIILSYNAVAELVPGSLADFYTYSNDASLKDLTVDGTTVDGFAAATLDYAVSLPYGTTAVPVVDAATTDDNASYEVVAATDLSGDAAARTATVNVTAEDGLTTAAYTVVFTVEPNSVPGFDISKISVYPVPAVENLTISGTSEISVVRVVDMRGAYIMEIQNNGAESMLIDLSGVESGMYLLELTRDDAREFVRISKK